MSKAPGLIVIKRLGVISIIMMMTLAGCTTGGSEAVSGSEIDPTLPSGTQSTSPADQTLTVFAAASLTNAFEEIGKGFEKTSPGVIVRFSFAGSQILRMQIEQGAAVDVFASADHKNMDLLITDKLLYSNSYQDFVSNKLVVILPPGNPVGVKTLADLADPKLKLILADSSVPAGKYARQVLANLSADPTFGSDFSERVLSNVVSNETDVKQVVTKVKLGEADAGIAYISDAIASPDLVTILIPDQFNVIAQYPIAVLNNTHELELSKAFIAYVLSPAGQAVLSQWGFSPVNH